MAVFAKYAGKIGTVTGTRTPLCKFKAFSVEWKSNTTSSIQILASSSFSSPSGYCRRSDYVKSSGGRLFLVDTLAQVRKLEAQGIPSKHAEAITSTITEVLSDSLENVAQSLIEMTLESSLSKFKSEVESSQGHHFSQLRSDIETLRTELRHEIDKVTAVARAELAKHNVETITLTTTLDRDIHAVRAQLEAAKYDVLKYCIGMAEGFKDGTSPIYLLHKDGTLVNSKKLLKLDAVLEYDYAEANPKHDPRKGKPGNGGGGKNP
ncbi:hypothetical protein AAG906_015720 [Vitis piasezkii]